VKTTVKTSTIANQIDDKTSPRPERHNRRGHVLTKSSWLPYLR